MPSTDPATGTPGTATASEFDPGLPFEDTPEVETPPEETPEAAAPEKPPEGTAGNEAAEASKKPEDGIAAPAAPATDDDAPDLSAVPEQLREVVRQYGDKRVAKLQSSWQDRLSKAAALDKFNERFKTDPEGLKRDFLALYEETHGKPAEGTPPPDAEPTDPGTDIPDPVEDPKAYRAYWQAFRRWNDYRLEKAVAEREAKVRKEIEPAVALAKQTAAIAKMKSIQAEIKASDEEMSEVLKLADDARTDPNKGFALIAEVVRLRKELSKAKDSKTKVAADAARGMEEKPGLPRAGAVRQKPKPTGNLTRDIAAELAHEGVPFPGEE